MIKKILKYYSFNVLELLEIDTTPYISKTYYISMYWGCPGMLKGRSGMDMVSGRWESIIFLFRDYIAIGSRYI